MPSKDYTFTGYRKEHREVARKLRRGMTEQERKLWFGFLKNHPDRFYSQRAINRFIVDFYCPKAKLVIELDGGQHYTEDGRAYDAERTKVLERYGIKVLRFSNLDVDKNFYAVCEEVNNVVLTRMNKNE